MRGGGQGQERGGEAYHVCVCLPVAGLHAVLASCWFASIMRIAVEDSLLIRITVIVVDSLTVVGT